MSLFAPILLAVVPVVPIATGQGADSDQDGPDFTALSLEELMNVEVVSASRKEQTLYDTAAAVYVITREDIERSGATAVPELLRAVPGVHVARISANSWAVTVRGFNNRYTNKLLVMVDGRSIYTSLFSGVYWEALGIPLELIERIEVIRGPGGTMWGANAVNGVINIITRSPRDVQGTSLDVLAGDEDRLFATAIHGGELDGGAWRAHVHGGARDEGLALGGGDGMDDWDGIGVGFRADWGDPEGDAFVLGADAFDAAARRTFTMLDPTIPGPVFVDEDFELPSASVLGRWTRRLSDGELSLQAYVDYQHVRSSVFDDERTTLDLDFQHRLRAGGDHEIVWGVASRLIEGKTAGGPGLDLQDDRRTDLVFSAFLQDELQLSDDVRLIGGVKLQHNSMTGFEVQPNVRALVHLDDRSSIWGAVSRAVRTPSVVDHGLVLPIDVSAGPPPVVTVILGDEDFESERLTAYEIGYRTQPTERLFVDVTAFFFDYDDLATLEPGAPIVGPVVVQPLLFENRSSAEATGIEVASDLRLGSSWHLRGAFSLFHLDVEADDDSLDPTAEDDEDSYPGYTASLTSHFAVADDLDLDLAVYAVDSLESGDIDSYVRVDARTAWRPSPGLELALGVRQLTDDSQQEFAGGFLSTATEIERAVYASVSWRP